jgi:acyl-coenzyme A synthetase/AMP-(fatty) acid ligase
MEISESFEQKLLEIADKPAILGLTNHPKMKSAFVNMNHLTKDYSYYSYKDLDKSVKIFSSYLNTKIKEKQNIWTIILLPMSLDLYSTILGTLNSPFPIGFLLPTRGRREIFRLIRSVESNIFITNTKGLILHPLTFKGTKTLVAEKSRISQLLKIMSLTDISLAGNPVTYHKNKSTIAIGTFSSGSNGSHKLISRSVEILENQHKKSAEVIDYRSNDIHYSTLPLFLLNSLLEGIQSIMPLHSSNEIKSITNSSLELSRKTMEDLGATILTTAPTYLRKLSRLNQNSLHQVGMKRIFVGGAPVSVDEIINIGNRWDCEVNVAFGCTEAEPISIMRSKDLSNNITGNFGYFPIGKKVNDLEINSSDRLIKNFYINNQILDGQLLQIKGSHVNSTGWLETGDYIAIDESDSFWFLGNKTGVFQYGKYYYSSVNIEYLIKKRFKIDVAVKYCQKGHVCVFIESVKKLNYEEQIKEYTRNQFIDSEIVVKIKYKVRIPRDLRHHSKTLYQQLICC